MDRELKLGEMRAAEGERKGKKAGGRWQARGGGGKRGSEREGVYVQKGKRSDARGHGKEGMGVGEEE